MKSKPYAHEKAARNKFKGIEFEPIPYSTT